MAIKNKRRIIFITFITLAILIFVGIVCLRIKNNSTSQKSIPDYKDQNPVINTEINNEENLVWYEIPEINIKFRVDREVASELIYKFKGKDDFGSVLFSSKELSQISNCGTEQGPLGALSKLKGNPNDYNDKEYFISRKPKLLNNSFIIYNGPQVVCAGTGIGDDAIKLEDFLENNPKLQGWISVVFDTIEPIIN